MKHPSDRLKQIEDFTFAEKSMMHRAKRYDEDVKFLLNVIYDERRRHAVCEEDMMVYANPAEVSKVMRLELLDKIVDLINKHYNEPFYTSENMEKFKTYCQIILVECQNSNDKQLLGKILQLFIEHFNRPSAC